MPSTSIPRMWMHENSRISPADHVAVYVDERIAFTFMDGNMPDKCARILAVLITWTIALQLNDRTARFCIFPVREAALVQSSRCHKAEKLELPSFSWIIPTFSCYKKRITWFDIVSNQVTYLGWIMGLEPTIFRATIWRLSQLGHIHHMKLFAEWHARRDSNPRPTA